MKNRLARQGDDKALSHFPNPHYINLVSLLTMAINGAWNKRCGPGGSTRRLHHILGGLIQGALKHGGETDSTRVVKTHLLPGIVPPLSG